MADERPVSAARLARSRRWALAAAEQRRKRLERKEALRQRHAEQAAELAAAFEQTGGNVAAAGRILGLTSQGVYARMARLRSWSWRS
jgi:transcriptional regulator with GAF, ATPase, and Fis domain